MYIRYNGDHKGITRGFQAAITKHIYGEIF